jgi:hypothetical protein
VGEGDTYVTGSRQAKGATKGRLADHSVNSSHTVADIAASLFESHPSAERDLLLLESLHRRVVFMKRVS